jgi:hypothetical protein
MNEINAISDAISEKPAVNTGIRAPRKPEAGATSSQPKSDTVTMPAQAKQATQMPEAPRRTICGSQ